MSKVGLRVLGVFIILAIGNLAAQESAWLCGTDKRTVTGKDFSKMWDFTTGIYSHTSKDTTTIIHFTSGETQVFSFKKKVKVAKSCKSLGFTYDKKENYCKGVMTKESLIKSVIQEGGTSIPVPVLRSLLDTMSNEDVLDIITDRKTASGTVEFSNGYGHRVLGNGEQNSFPLNITEDSPYYLKADNIGILSQAYFTLHKKSLHLSWSMTFLDTYTEVEGTCQSIEQ